MPNCLSECPPIFSINTNIIDCDFGYNDMVQIEQLMSLQEISSGLFYIPDKLKYSILQ